MDYVTLGNSDLSVSRICVGGMSFGRPSADFHEWTLGPEETEQMVVRALGASAMYGYQFHNMQMCAEQNGFTQFVSMQNHYNLLYREDERELIPVCRQYNVSLTPYSPLAAGRLSRMEWTAGTKRSQTDRTARSKYDGTEAQDSEIVRSVHEVAERYGATMSQVAIAWQYAKGIASPIIGATKPEYLDDAAKASGITLTEADIVALEQHYLPHKVVGAL